MKTVYVATNTADAHVVKGLLRQAGIEAVVLDENVGPYGDSLGSVRVAVAPENETASRDIIADWEATAPQEQRDPVVRHAPRSRAASRDTLVVAAGIAALLAVVWYFGGR